MAKLNQIIAIEKGIKGRSYGHLTELNKVVQKPELFNGFSKVYQKRDEDGEDLPPERKRVQYNATDVLSGAAAALSELMEVTARKDWSNCHAKATVKVDGQTILAEVPVTYLLFMEKQLTDMRTFVANIPVLDEAEDWGKDEASGLYKAATMNTHRTKKVQRPLVLYHATAEHPAQTQVVTEDVIAGFWAQTKQSGAIPKPEKQRIALRVETLLRAVKEAREEANMVDEVKTPNVGKAVFEYLIGKPDSSA